MPEPPDARAREVQGHRRAERAGADHQHARVAQRELGELGPLRQHELARVALHLRVAEPRLRGPTDSLSTASRAFAAVRAAARAISRRKPRRELLIARTIRTSVPSTSTPWPASRAERGTFSSASPGGQRTSSTSPAAIRSSSSFVRTQVIGQRSDVISSERTT